jgi:hypothetical protein
VIYIYRLICVSRVKKKFSTEKKKAQRKRKIKRKKLK